MKLGEPLPLRKKHLADLKQEQSTKTYQMRFQSEFQSFGIHRVSVEFPKYRLENGRTISAQEEYLVTHQLPKDFFTKDAESNEAQEVQHEILYEMITRSTPNLVAFFKDEEQDEPLILDSLGFVVNGNRRLCAMRTLYDQDPKQYQRFSNIDVIILPPVERKDVYALEVSLQIMEDIKEDYSWTDEASMIRRGRDELGFSYDELAKMYRRTKKEMKDLLDAFDHADAYLEERGWSKEYHRVADAELTFDKLRENRKKVSNETEGELFEKITYTLIDNPDSGLGRLYKAVQEVREHLTPIVEQLKEELPLDNGSTTHQPSGATDPFGLLPPDEGDFDKVVAAVREPEHREAVRGTVIAVIENERAKGKVKKTTSAAFTHAKGAHTSLREALNALNEQSDTSGMEAQLDGIEKAVAELRSRLSQYA